MSSSKETMWVLIYDRHFYGLYIFLTMASTLRHWWNEMKLFMFTLPKCTVIIVGKSYWTTFINRQFFIHLKVISNYSLQYIHSNRKGKPCSEQHRISVQHMCVASEREMQRLELTQMALSNIFMITMVIRREWPRWVISAEKKTNRNNLNVYFKCIIIRM